LGLSRALLSHSAWDLAAIPIHMGGLGIRRATDQHMPTYLGSISDSAPPPLVQDITGFSVFTDIQYKIWARFCTQVDSDSNIPFEDNACQRDLQSAVDIKLWDKLWQSTSCTRERARLRSLTLPPPHLKKLFLAKARRVFTPPLGFSILTRGPVSTSD